MRNKKRKNSGSFKIRLLSKLLPQSDSYYLTGDFLEIYDTYVKMHRPFKAKWFILTQILKSIPLFLSNSIYWSSAMFNNYLKVGLRSIKKQRIYSVITISGLAVGLGIFIFCAQIFDLHSSYNKFHKNAKRIYGVVQVVPSSNEGDQHSAITPPPLLPALVQEFPEIDEGARFSPAGRIVVKYGDNIFYENRALFVDRNFLNIFSFEMSAGNPQTVFSEPYSIVLTEEMALKYFGDENPVGKSLTIDNKIAVTINGVMKDVPRPSSIQFDFLISMETARALHSWMNDWTVYNQAAFLLLPEGFNPFLLEEKLPAIIDKYFPASVEKPSGMYLLPLLDVYLNSFEIRSYMENTHPAVPVLMIVIGMIVLLVVCINFVNLSTARYSTRMKEVGMRKVIGAHRFNLIKQFLGESVLMSVIAFPAAVAFYELVVFIMIALGGTDRGSVWSSPHKLLIYLGISVLVGIFAGIYPAFFLSAFKPVKVLKEELRSGKKGSRFRKIQVVLQFTLSIIFITITIIIGRQADHFFNIDLGYNRSGVVIVPLAGIDDDDIEPLKREMERNPAILSVSAAAAVPVNWGTERPVIPEGMNENEAWTMKTYVIDYGFIETLEIEIFQGRSFAKEIADENNCIINEAALEQLEWEDPIGKQLTIGNREITIIGTAKNFHFHSIDDPIPPVVLYLDREKLNYLLIKVSSSEKISDVIKYLETQWHTFSPDLPFEHTSINNYYQDMSRAIKMGGRLLGAMGLFAIFYSAMGLLGLISYAIEQRTKEIGIRKVLGASVSGIVRTLLKEFIVLVAIANTIGLPIAYFISSRLLQSGTYYPLKIGTGVFIFVAVITFIITFTAVASQTVRAAFANPVDCLRYE